MSDIQEFVDFVANIPTVDTIAYLNDVMGRQGVKVIYEKATDFTAEYPKYNRIMFSVFRRSCDYKFSGAIIQFDGEKYVPVSIPPRPPSTEYTNQELITVLDDQHTVVREARDGSTVTLYWHKDKWVISTHKGYEVNKFTWFGRTWQEVLDEVFAKVLPGFDYNQLDKDHCYTLGFKHSAFHPFREKYDGNNIVECSAWFIRSVNMKTFDINRENSSDLSDLKPQNIVNRTYHQLIMDAKFAADSFGETGHANYGYIVTNNGKNYLIESMLMKGIRNIFYSKRFNNLDKSIDKVTYVAIYAFLDNKLYKTCSTLFPQFNNLFKSLDDILQRITEKILIYMKDGPAVTSRVKPRNLGNAAALFIAKDIMAQLSVANMSLNDLKILVGKFVTNPRFTNMLYAINHLTI